jgi:hypothetical protein
MIEPSSAARVGGDRPVVLLLTSNGWGMGHLSRQLALAMALGDRAEPVFMSLSGAVHLAAGQGFRAEYVPSPSRGWLQAAPWNEYLNRRILALARETKARAIVFDGVHPYRGLVAARRELPGVAFVWSRRGMWTVGRGEDALKTADWFDLIVEPGDLGAAADPGLTVGRTDAVRVPPVSLLDVVPPLGRKEARAVLGLDPNAPTALVALSAGTGDPAALLGRALAVIESRPGWHVAVITNPLKPNPAISADDPRVKPLVNVYPLVRYLAAFDAAIASAGYNAAHELPLAGIPTLLVANIASAWDDQVSRARGIEERGLAISARDDRPSEVEARTAELMDEACRARLKSALAAMGPTERGGAVAVADLVARILVERPRPVEALRRPGVIDQARLRARAVRRAWRWRPRRPRHSAVYYARLVAFRVLRRPIASDRTRSTQPASAERTFTFVDDPPETPVDAPAANADRSDLLLVTERLTREVIAGAGPVEQLLPGSSARYRRERLAIARRFFPPAKAGTGE